MLVMRWRRRWGVGLTILALVVMWLASCEGFAAWLQRDVLRPPQALSAMDIARYALVARREGPVQSAIVVLGGGREPASPEYGEADLSARSLARLRYGVWLSRRTGLPLAFSGGIGWGDPNAGIGPGEADIAARIAQDEYGVVMRWRESASADTRANAAAMVPVLAQAGVQEVLLVTDASHMPRALRAFRSEVARREARPSVQPASAPMVVTPAPIAYVNPGRRTWMAWLPSAAGLADTMQALHECLGWLAGQ